MHTFRSGVLIGIAAFAVLGCKGSSGGGGGGAGTSGPFRRARGASGPVHALLSDGSGRVLVGGSFTHFNTTAVPALTRLVAAGVPDPTFAAGGGAEPGATVYEIALATDGSGDLYVGGSFITWGGVQSERMARLNADGSLDAAFVVGTGFDDDVASIAPALDGSGDVYVTGGAFVQYQGTPVPGLARLDSNGSLDGGFAIGAGPTGGSPFVVVAALDGTGDVYVGGEFTDFNGTPAARIVRLNSNGSVDAGFATGTGFDGDVKAILPATDGSGDVYVGGLFGQFNGVQRRGLVRLNANGSLDLSLDVASGFNEEIRCIVETTDGSGDLVVVGAFTTFRSTTHHRIARLNADGTPDAAFVSGAGFNGPVNTVLSASDGSGDILVGGEFTRYGSTGANRLVRLNQDGSIDPGIATGAALDFVAYDFARVGGGVYVAGGASYNGVACPGLIRLNLDGSVDAGFQVGIGFDFEARVLALALDGSSDLFVGGGFTMYNGTARNRLVRLNADGSIDPAFTIGSGFASGAVVALVPATDGSGDLYVAGSFTWYDGGPAPGIIRLNADGSRDPAFATGTGFVSTVRTMVDAGDGTGDIYVGGDFNSYNGSPAGHIVRLNANGSIDTAFTTGSGFNNTVFDVAPARDGSGDLYVGGWFMTYQGAAAPHLVRLNSDGAVDAGFATGAGPDQAVLSMTIAEDGSGDLWIGGWFSAYAGTPAGYVARVRPNGALHPAFVGAVGLNSTIEAVASDGSGGVFVGGYFTVYRDAVVDRIAHVFADGSLDK